MLSKRATVTRATALEFRVPSSRGARVDGSYEHNVLIRIEAGMRGRTIEGIGEASPRGRALTGDSKSRSWRFLRSALQQLEGTTLRARAEPARADLVDIMAGLRSLAATVSKEPEAAAFRGMLAGVDAALADLAAKTVGTALADFLGGTRRPVEAAAVVRAHRTSSRLLRDLRACAGYPAINLVDIAGPDAAIDAAATAASVAGLGTPLWLGLGGTLTRAQGEKLVEMLADRMSAGELPRHLVLQPPHDSVTPADLVEWQAIADVKVPPDPSGPGIVLMGDAACAATAKKLAGSGLKKISLNVQRVGGALAVLDVARQLHTEYADVRLGLSTVPHISGVGACTMAELATALPNLDYCALSSSIISGPVTCVPPVEHDDTRRIRPGEGPGLGGTAVLTPATHLLTRHLEWPRRRAPRSTYGGLPVNRFDTGPLQPFTTQRGEIRSASPLIERAALIRGLNTRRFSRDVVMVEHPRLAEPLCFTPSKTASTGTPAHRATVDKELTRRLLQAAGVPVPQGASFSAAKPERAVQYAASLGKPVVVKPKNGIHGTGVSTDLRTEQSVRAAIESLAGTKFGSQPFVVETYVPGDDYRLLVVGDQVVSVVLKKPASVTGDGRSSVVDLVIEKNKERLENPHTRSCLLRFDTAAMHWLQRQELTPDSVPEQGRHVRLGSAGNIAAGGESIEVLDQTHPSILDLAVRAVHAVPGLDHAGVDLMGDHVRGTDEAAAIIEINGNPATAFNHFPLSGTPRDVSSHLVLRGCELAGFDPGPPRDVLSMRIEIEGRVQGVGYRQWFARLAEDNGLAGSIRNLPGGGVEALVTGGPHAAWVVAAAAINGPRRASVLQVTTTHVSGVEPANRFEVHR
ncbi:acylphosphatase [Phytoactinopolyspora mesophila]|nr:acylphosphatase [Phytoactinopolyspora mesophila]